jgi:Fe-S-cluster-containing hydrogenase component 2
VFVIDSRNVKISPKTWGNVDQAVDHLGTGQHFGEIGLMSTRSAGIQSRLPAALIGRRTATCTALDRVKLIRIGRATFEALLNLDSEVAEVIERNCVELLEKDATTHSTVHQLGKFLDQGLFQGQSLLLIHLNKCTRCEECVRACERTHGNVSRLSLAGSRFGHYLVPTACRSCYDPVCLIGCPVDAIHRAPADRDASGAPRGLAITIEDHCIGCGLCAENCPFGSIHMHERDEGQRRAAVKDPRRIATNCDLCESLDSVPRCVYMCPHDAAHGVTGDDLANGLGVKPLGRLNR